MRACSLAFWRRHSAHAVLVAVLAGCIALCSVANAKRVTARRARPASDAASSGRVYEGTALAVRIYFKPLPETMPGHRDDTPAMIALGRRLYHERDLSETRSQSCNDCHRVDQRQSGVDCAPTSMGAKGTRGARNSPTVVNAGFQVMQFWDGRAPDLVEQAKGPLLNPIEMAMGSESDVVDRLRARADYSRDFAAAFPGHAEPVTFDNAARAIAAFERTLVAPARFDRYLKGDTSALTREEKRGLERFVNTGCVACHNSYPVGGRSLQKLGVYHPYRNRKDLGRYNVTHLEEDRFVFKVPMLRNVTLTPPYFHDGTVSTLPEAVRLMGWMQLNKPLSPREVSEIVPFLHALETEHPLRDTEP